MTVSSSLPRPLISVVIPTRNRADLLRKAIASVVNQKFPREDYEILIVDNGSTDRTLEVALGFQSEVKIHYIREGRIGSSIARNTGWRSAGGQYIAFLDDDAIAQPDWLKAIQEAFESAPAAGIIGGRVEPIWESMRPNWLTDEIAHSLSILDWGPSPKIIQDTRREWLVSANMAVPKTVLSDIGGFHPWLSRVGRSLMSNDDVFLQREAMRRGYRCLYAPAMVVEHPVSPSRLSQEWFLRRFFWQGISDAVMHIVEKSPSPAERFHLALSRTAQVFRSRRSIAALMFHTEQPDTFRAKCFVLIDIGYILGLLGAARR